MDDARAAATTGGGHGAGGGCQVTRYTPRQVRSPPCTPSAVAGIAAPFLFFILLAALVIAGGTSGRTAAEDISLVFDPASSRWSRRPWKDRRSPSAPTRASSMSRARWIPTPEPERLRTAPYFEGRTSATTTEDGADSFCPTPWAATCRRDPGGLGAGPGGGNPSLVALSKGYVVAAPGARGRRSGTNRDAAGKFTGRAPSAIVDLEGARGPLPEVQRQPRLPGARREERAFKIRSPT